MAAQPLRLGFPVRFEEAIRWARARQVLLPDDYYDQLPRNAQHQAFTVLGLTEIEQIRQVWDGLTEAVASGTSFRDWVKGFQPERFGITAQRAELIYRNAVQTAYAAGRETQLQRNKHRRPYAMYDAINDSRTRPAHRAMDGHIEPLDSPWWTTHTPPCGHRCRCTKIGLSEAEAVRRGYGAQGIPAASADPGWGAPPASHAERLAELERTALRGVPPQVRDALTSAAGAVRDPVLKVVPFAGQQDLDRVFAALAGRRPDWFGEAGYQGVRAVADDELYAAWDAGVFYFSAADALSPGFAPIRELSSALFGIRDRRTLSFHEEYAVEVMWHEMLHARYPARPTRHVTRHWLLEAVHQTVARRTYPRLLAELGARPAHLDTIVGGGLAYAEPTSNLNRMCVTLGINPVAWEAALDLPEADLVYEAVRRAAAVQVGLSTKQMGQLLRYAEAKSRNDFDAKLAQMQAYVRR